MGDCIKNMILRVSCIHSWGERFHIEHPSNMEGIESQAGKVGGSRYICTPRLESSSSQILVIAATPFPLRSAIEVNHPLAMGGPWPKLGPQTHSDTWAQARADAGAKPILMLLPLVSRLALGLPCCDTCLLILWMAAQTSDTFCFFCRHLSELTSDACLQLQQTNSPFQKYDTIWKRILLILLLLLRRRGVGAWNLGTPGWGELKSPALSIACRNTWKYWQKQMLEGNPSTACWASQQG